MRNRIWRNKPPRGTPIDYSHRFAKGLIFFVAFNESTGTPVELVNNKLPSSNSNFGYTSNSYGGAGKFLGAASLTDLTYNSVPAVGPAMSTAGFFIPSIIPNNVMLIERSPVNGTWAVLFNSTSLVWRGAGSAGTGRFVYNTALVANTPYVFGVTDLGITGISNIQGYLNGVNLTNSGSTSNPAPASNNQNIHLGNYDALNFAFQGQIGWWAVWNYSLSASVMKEITNNPNAIWQMFRPKFNLLEYSNKGVIFLSSNILFDNTGYLSINNVKNTQSNLQLSGESSLSINDIKLTSSTISLSMDGNLSINGLKTTLNYVSFQLENNETFAVRKNISSAVKFSLDGNYSTVLVSAGIKLNYTVNFSLKSTPLVEFSLQAPSIVNFSLISTINIPIDLCGVS